MESPLQNHMHSLIFDNKKRKRVKIFLESFGKMPSFYLPYKMPMKVNEKDYVVRF